MSRRVAITAACLLAGACLPGTVHAATPSPPPAITLSSGWTVRDLFVPPAPPQPPPPDESGGQGGGDSTQPTVAPTPKRLPFNPALRPVTIPNVFDPDASPELYGGSKKEYRLRFTAPKTRAYTWAFRFEEVRRRATVYLNGKKIGTSVDPYTPFQVPAKGLRPGALNELRVTVDSRKDPRLPEGWWNWGGIVRPVHLVPMGNPSIEDVGTIPDVKCAGPAVNCRASLRLDGILSKLPKAKQKYKGKARKAIPLPQPKLGVVLRAPSGRVIKKNYSLKGYRSKRVRLNELKPVAVPLPELWAPERPQLYDVSVTLTYNGRRQQVDRRKIGMRSSKVVGGLLTINNRAVNIRGVAIHEDMPGHGAALTDADMDKIVAEVKESGANTVRAHYLLSEGLLNRFDRVGIMVWNEAPIWQRDTGANLLKYPSERKRAVAQVERTVKAGRNHPSVITHAVANELAIRPDTKSGTRIFIEASTQAARDLDPTLPISLDIKGRPGYDEQFVYQRLDMIGVNQYFGWYPWVADFNGLTAYLQQLHAWYPDKALVNTEFGAEGRADFAKYPDDVKGTYAFQKQHVARTIDTVAALPFMSGMVHWTLREFEIYPNWYGGIDRNPMDPRMTRHYKGILTYDGAKKPAWQALHDRYVATPLYR